MSAGGDGRRPPTPRGLRLLGVLAAALLLIALVVASSRERNPVEPEGDPTSLGAPSDVASEGLDEELPEIDRVDVTVLGDVEGAEESGAVAVLAAGAQAAGDDWRQLTDAAWAPALVTARPVYVGHLVVDPTRSAVLGDVAIAFVAEGGDELALRFLPGSEVLTASGAGATADVSVDGRAVGSTIDGAAGLLRVPGPFAAGAPTLLRIRFAYQVPDRATIVNDGGPAGFGLLARSAGVTVLGHGFPLLTFDADPMVPWGDVGAFPVAIWSMRISAPGVVVTGGDESACPTTTSETDASGASCTWARGTTLRDLAVAVFDAGAVVARAGQGDRLKVVVTGASGTSGARMQAAADEASAADEIYAEALGPLPWPELDVVLAPLSQAAGMEFPGLVVVDPEYLDRLGGGFGTFVVVHEVAHQWFHALVGNSSLDDAVVDESLAQFLSLWYYRDVLGEAAASDLLDARLAERYRSAREAGLVDIAPASPLAAFGGNDAYGPLVYARSPLAWTSGEAAVGREVVAAFLAQLVRDAGLGEVTAADVVDRARRDVPALADVLDRWWFDPTPVDDELS